MTDLKPTAPSPPPTAAAGPAAALRQPWVALLVLALGLATTAVFIRVMSAYFIFEMVRVPKGIEARGPGGETLVLPNLLPDEIGYQATLMVLSDTATDERLPRAERPIGLPLAALFFTTTGENNLVSPWRIIGYGHSVFWRGARYLQRHFMGVKAADQKAWAMPPYCQEVFTAQILSAALAIAVVVLLWGRVGVSPSDQPPTALSTYGVPVLAGLFMTIDPLLVGLSGFMLSETLFVALVTILLVLVAQPRFSWTVAGAAAVVASAMVYTRPAAWLFVALPLLWRLVRGETETFPPEPTGQPDLGRLRRLRSIVARPAGFLPVAVLALATLLPLPWMIRNALQPDGRFAMTSLEGLTFYDSVGPQATGRSNQAGFRREAAQAGCKNEWQTSRYFSDKAWSAIASDPLHVLALVPAKLWATFSPMPNADEYRAGSSGWIIAGWTVGIYVLAALGFWTLKRRRQLWLAILLVLPAITIAILHSVAVGSIRYRAPAMPGLEILAAYAVIAWLTAPAREAPEAPAAPLKLRTRTAEPARQTL